MNDQEKIWTKALKNGSRLAFTQIYKLYADKVYRVSRRMYLHNEEAREMVQEVFLTLWEQRSALNETLSLNAYLLTITRHKIINYQKKRAAELAWTHLFQSSHSASYINTEDLIHYKDMESRTFQFINMLPARHRQIFLLSRHTGLSNEEIANQLNLSRRTVENNIYQAEKAIRQFLQKIQFIIRSLALFFVWMM
jgi:RNA polymerase sigma-70 factor (family 1)